MLPVYKLMEKIGEAYDHALNERVEEFRTLDKEISSLVPLYIQHITYSCQSVKSLNNVQLSTLFTQVVKALLTGSTLVGVTVLFLFMPYFEGTLSTLLATATIIFGLAYAWKKIPILRGVWESTQNIDRHSANLYVSLSECIRSLEEIKAFHQATIPTVEEWERKGLIKEEKDVSMEEAQETINQFLKELSKGGEPNQDDQDK